MVSMGGEGPETTDDDWRRPWGLYVAVALLAVAVIAGAVTQFVRDSGGSSGSATSSRSSVEPEPTSSPLTRIAGPTRKPVPRSSPKARQPSGHPLLTGVPAGWQVVALTRQSLSKPFQLVRIVPASGKITTAAGPPLLSSGGVALVVGSKQVLVHPWDNVPGYLFPRGGQAQKLTADPIGSVGPAFPGPRLDQVWVSEPDHPRRARLVGFDGTRTGMTLRPPTDQWTRLSVADGAGGLLVQTTHGAYDLRPSGRQRVTTGTVVAIGTTTWVTRPCRPQDQCNKLTVINRSTGARQSVPSPCPADSRPAAAPLSGSVSSDGRSAAIFCASNSPNFTLYLLDLTTGRGHRIHMRLQDIDTGLAGLVWSPNSHWLLTIDHAGRLTAVDRDTRRVRTLAPNLPPLAQLATR